MTRWSLGACLGAGLAMAAITAGAPRVRAQASPDPSRVIIVTGGEASAPVPTLNEGPQSSVANTDIADQLFLHLADLGPTLITSGDHAFEPRLARSWTRRDSVTLAFDLDPRATLAGRRAGHVARCGLHLRARARPRPRAEPITTAAPHRVGDRRERPSSRDPIFASLRRAALRRRVPRGAPAGPPPRADSARQPRAVRLRPGAGGKRAVPVGAASARPVHRAGGEFAVLPWRTGDTACLLSPRVRSAGKIQHGSWRRGRRDGQHPASPQQRGARRRDIQPAGRPFPIQCRGLPAVQSA